MIAADNTGNGNGLQGRMNALGASGVYGENNGGGFGVAGRSNEAIGGRGDVQEGAVGTKAALVASDPSLYVPPNGDPPFATGWFVKGKAMQDNYNTWLDVSAYAIYAFVSQ